LFPHGTERLLYKSGQRLHLTFLKLPVGWRDWEILAAIQGWAGWYPSSRHVWFGDLMPLHQLDTCLTGLKQQGISVSEGVLGENGSTFEVMGFTLTAEQIVELHQNGQMDANGIKAFAKSIKQDF